LFSSTINCRTNGDNLLLHNGNGAVFTFDQCDLSIEPGITGILQDNGDGSNNTFLTNSYAFVDDSGKLFDIVTGGVIWADYADVEGVNAQASTINTGAFVARFCSILTPLHSPVVGGSITLQFCQFGTVSTPFQNVTWINNESTTPGATTNIYYCRFSSGTESSVKNALGSTLNIYNCNINSSNSNAIDNAGTMSYGNLTFLNSSSIGAGTQNAVYTELAKYRASGQPLLIARKSTTSNNQTGAGNNAVVIFDNVVIDQNGNYDNTTGIFTAPINGSYPTNTIITCNNIDSLMTTGVYLISTPSGNYKYELNPSNAVSANGNVCFVIPAVIYLNAGEQIYCAIQISNGAADTAGIVGDFDFSTYLTVNQAT